MRGTNLESETDSMSVVTPVGTSAIAMIARESVRRIVGCLVGISERTRKRQVGRWRGTNARI